MTEEERDKLFIDMVMMQNTVILEGIAALLKIYTSNSINETNRATDNAIAIKTKMSELIEISKNVVNVLRDVKIKKETQAGGEHAGNDQTSSSLQI